MTREDVKDVLKEVKGEAFDHETDLISGGWISSFDLIYLIEIIEEKNDIRIPLDMITPDQFNNVDDIWGLLKDLEGK